MVEVEINVKVTGKYDHDEIEATYRFSEDTLSESTSEALHVGLKQAMENILGEQN